MLKIFYLSDEQRTALRIRDSWFESDPITYLGMFFFYSVLFCSVVC